MKIVYNIYKISVLIYVYAYMLIFLWTVLYDIVCGNHICQQYIYYLYMKSSFAKTDNLFFQKSFFYCVFLGNINHTAVGLFWLSNNNLNKYG